MADAEGVLQTKICTGCEQDKSLDSYPPDLRRKDGKGTKCRVCVLEVKKAYLARYPDKDAARRLKQAEHGAAWYRRNYDKQIKRFRENGLIRKYGISVEDYQRMLDRQEGRCAICGADKPGRNNKTFAVDHSHIDGSVRGLLCIKCNSGIGFFRDDPSLIRRAAFYVENGGAIG